MGKNLKKKLQGQSSWNWTLQKGTSFEQTICILLAKYTRSMPVTCTNDNNNTDQKEYDKISNNHYYHL